VPATTSTAMAQLLSAMVVLVVDPLAGGRTVVLATLVLTGATVVVDVAGDVVVVTIVTVVPASVLPSNDVVVDGVEVEEARATAVVLAGIVVATGVVVAVPDVASSSPPHAAITRVPAMRSSAGVFMWRGLVERCVGGQRTWCHCRRGLLESPTFVHIDFTPKGYKI